MRILVAAGLAMMCLSAANGWAQVAHTRSRSAEDWAWEQLRNDKVADFDTRPGCASFNPATTGEDDSCRRIPAEFLVRILTRKEWRDQLPRPRVRLRHAHIIGDIDLSDDEIGPELWLDDSRIDANLRLADSHWERLLSLEGTVLSGDLLAWRMRADSNLLLDQGSTFSGGVYLAGARVGGDLQMAGSYFDRGLKGDKLDIAGNLFMDGRASFDGEVNLTSAKVAGELTAAGSRFKKEFVAYRLILESNLFIDNGTFFDGTVNMGDARIGGNLEMGGSTFSAGFEGSGIAVGSSLYMSKKARFDGRVNLAGARIGNILDMSGAFFAGSIYADSLSVGGHFFMGGGASFGGQVNLDGARIGGNLVAVPSTFLNGISAERANVAGNLLLNKTNMFGNLNLHEADIGQNLEISDSFVSGNVSLNSDNISKTVFLKNSTFVNDIDLVVAKIGGNLQLDGARLYATVNAQRASVNGSVLIDHAQSWKELQLMGAKISNILRVERGTIARIDLSEGDTGHLELGDVQWWCIGGQTPVDVDDEASAWESPHGAYWPLNDSPLAKLRCGGQDTPALILHNFHVADFQGGENAWPPVMDLSGFHYDRAGSLADDQDSDRWASLPRHWYHWFDPRSFSGLLRRLAGEDRCGEGSVIRWLNWLCRNQTFSIQPYSELSSVLGTEGHRNVADEVEFAGLEQDRYDARKNDRSHYWWMTVRYGLFGYDLGRHAAYVFIWVGILTGLGTVILCFSPNARRRSFWWRAGASLHRLLPIIELSKEFTNFFDNPPPQFDEESNLKPWQIAYFAGHAISGWVLGLLLLAAMSGLTQKG